MSNLTQGLKPFSFTPPSGAPVVPRLAAMADPDPRIGAVTCAVSNIDQDGFSIYDNMSQLIVDPSKRGMDLWKRALVSVFPIAPMFAIAGAFLVGALLGAVGLSDAILKPLALLGALGSGGLGFAFGMWATKRLGLPFRNGLNFWLGERGIDFVQAENNERKRVTALYDGPEYWFHNHESVTINGNYSYDLESLNIRDARVQGLGTVVGTYHAAAGPNDECLAMRLAVQKWLAVRAPMAKVAVQGGKDLLFPIVETVGFQQNFLGEQLVVKNGFLFHEKSGRQRRIALSNVASCLRNGTLYVSSRDPGDGAPWEFKSSLVANGLLIPALFPEKR